jgi:hypothetical protein
MMAAAAATVRIPRQHALNRNITSVALRASTLQTYLNGLFTMRSLCRAQACLTSSFKQRRACWKKSRRVPTVGPQNVAV